MSFIDNIARSQASKAIASYGKIATLNKIAVGTYDTVTGTTANTTTAYSVKILIDSYAQNLIDGTIVKQGDMKITMPALNNQTPVPGDDLVFDGVTRNIVAVENVYSGEQIASFTIQARA